MRGALNPRNYKEFYEEWWRKYPEDEIVETSEAGRQRISKTLELFFKHVLDEKGVVADVGTGAGVMALNILKRGRNFKVVGVDIAEASVRKFLEKAAKGGLANRAWGIVGDACNLPLASNSLDALVVCEVLEHVLKPEEMVSEVMRVLRPGGVAVVTTPNSVCRLISFRKPWRMGLYLLYYLFGVERDCAWELVAPGEISALYGVTPTLYRHGSYSPKKLASLFKRKGAQILARGAIVQPAHRIGILNKLRRLKIFEHGGKWSFVVVRKGVKV